MSDIKSKGTLTKELYLTDLPSDVILPKHYIWQSPLLFPEDITDFDELDQRIKQAGKLWLKNGDIRPFSLLVITHKKAWISYLFQRAQYPNQVPLSIGPIPRSLINKGTSILPYPIIFQESKEVIDQEKLRIFLKDIENKKN